ncbi:MAG: response regulator [Candidatus Omnitrophota bacterium]
MPHVIILDLMMPEKSGLQVLSAVRSLSPSARIIIFTGFAQYKDSPYLSVVDRIILKGEHTGELVGAVEELA